MNKWEDDWQKELNKRTGDDGYATFSPDNIEDVNAIHKLYDDMISESKRKVDLFIEKYGDINVGEYLLHPERFNFTEEEQRIIDSLLEGGL